MASSKCPSCPCATFETELATARNYNFKVNLVKCQSCGAVVGVLPFYDPGESGHQNEAQVKDLKASLTRLEQAVATLLARR